jgi:hypothetical protein
MTEYREDAEKKNPSTSTNNEGSSIAAVSHGEAAYMTLAAQYGLDDDMIIGIPGKYQRSVEEEYQAYITAPTLSGKVDPLKFWEVRGDVNSA